MNSTTGKSDRLLQIYSRLVNGEILSKKEMADQFHITERSVQRDVEACDASSRNRASART